jgi:hypothetical protein
MFASVIRNSMTAVASAVCSESVAFASVAALACAVALLDSILRRTAPHKSGAQATLPSSDPAVTVPPNPGVFRPLAACCLVTEPVTPAVGYKALRATCTSANASW